VQESRRLTPAEFQEVVKDVRTLYHAVDSEDNQEAVHSVLGILNLLGESLKKLRSSIEEEERLRSENNAYYERVLKLSRAQALLQDQDDHSHTDHSLQRQLRLELVQIKKALALRTWQLYYVHLSSWATPRDIAAKPKGSPQRCDQCALCSPGNTKQVQVPEHNESTCDGISQPDEVLSIVVRESAQLREMCLQILFTLCDYEGIESSNLIQLAWSAMASHGPSQSEAATSDALQTTHEASLSELQQANRTEELQHVTLRQMEYSKKPEQDGFSHSQLECLLAILPSDPARFGQVVGSILEEIIKSQQSAKYALGELLNELQQLQLHTKGMEELLKDAKEQHHERQVLPEEKYAELQKGLAEVRALYEAAEEDKQRLQQEKNQQRQENIKLEQQVLALQCDQSKSNELLQKALNREHTLKQQTRETLVECREAQATAALSYPTSAESSQSNQSLLWQHEASIDCQLLIQIVTITTMLLAVIFFVSLQILQWSNLQILISVQRKMLV